MKLTFWGATRQVTGSMYLLEVNDTRILIDCGLDVGRERNQEDEDLAIPPAYPGALFPFDASTVEAVLLTHAHIDHSGMIPNLVRDGFEGRIYCTSPTRDLTEILLFDSANLHRKKLKSLHNKHGKKADAELKEAAKTFYLESHVGNSLEYFKTIAPDKSFPLTDTIQVTFFTAGHLLGASSIYLEIKEGDKTTRIGFSGDIGRFNYPLLQDPKPFPEVDYLICESTYGNRRHTDREDPVDILQRVIQRTCVDIPGRLIIPAFSVGRTQALLYTLNKLYTERGFDPIKVFSDSPMALQSTKVYSRYTDWLNPASREFRQRHHSLFDFENFEFVPDPEKSKALSDYNEPSIIISSSGMIKGGRIEYHVRRNLENPYATIFIVGFAPEGTLSHSLINGLSVVKNDGKEFKVQANIERTDIFSGHADVDGLLGFVGQQDKGKLKSIFLIHGDFQPMQDLKGTLEGEGFQRVEMPTMGQTYHL